MSLSFLSVGFVRILELLQVVPRGNGELAVEVIMLRHEVAVSCRQVARPADPDEILGTHGSHPGVRTGCVRPTDDVLVTHKSLSKQP